MGVLLRASSLDLISLSDDDFTIRHIIDFSKI